MALSAVFPIYNYYLYYSIKKAKKWAVWAEKGTLLLIFWRMCAIIGEVGLGSMDFSSEGVERTCVLKC